MKRIVQIFTLLLVLAIPLSAYAKPRTYYLYLGKTDSGNTTVMNGGVSNMTVRGDGHDRSAGTYIIHSVDEKFDGYFTVQLTATTPSQAQIGLGGDWSGVSFTLRYRISEIDNANAWAGASNYDVPEFSGMALSSGTSRRQVTVEIPITKYLRFDFLTNGNTVFGHAGFILRAK